MKTIDAFEKVKYSVRYVYGMTNLVKQRSPHCSKWACVCVT